MLFPTLSQAAPSSDCFSLTMQLSEMNPGLYGSFFQVAVVMHGAIQWKSRHMFFLLLQQLLTEPFDEVRQEDGFRRHTHTPPAQAGGSQVICCQCVNSNTSVNAYVRMYLHICTCAWTHRLHMLLKVV